ncbi:carbonic anhydrase [Methylocucumis oryzae]|uniref:carbonic anhydrase n=1 Tax=Methylocucumis oryzae TaxID=1632867 RepID=UPI000697FE56|nr:carbonic anhydrase [Methylocucumis oryzae]
MSACYRYVLDQVTPSDSVDNADVREIDIENLQNHQHLVERAAIRGSLDNLQTYPWIKQRLDDKTLQLHGWWFDLETGDLWATNEDNSTFLPVLD